MTSITVSRLHFPVTTLGPGRRLGIWLQGCSIQCPGCISVDTWSTKQGLTTTGEVVQALLPWLPNAEGITISGGEPFDQPEALAALLLDLRRLSPVDILLYSGYSFDELAGWFQHNPGLVDALISEPYDERASQTLALRGSDNQRFHFLTELGRTRFTEWDRLTVPGDHCFDVMFDKDGIVWLAGIPARDDFRLLEQALRADGHTVTLSQSKPAEASS